MTSLRALTILFSERLADEPDHAKPQGHRLFLALTAYQPRSGRPEDRERQNVLRELDGFERVREHR